MANVTFTFNPTPAPACYPPDINGLAQELTDGGILVGTIPDTAGGGIFVGSSPPSSSLANKVWFKVDSAGRPLGTYMYYNGNWRKVYTGVGLGEIRMWSGTNAEFDGTGRGVVGGDLDGWALCNGQNATPNLADKFLVGAESFGGSGWQAAPDGITLGTTGGSGVINCINLPDLFGVGFGVQVPTTTTGGSLVFTNETTAQPFDIPVNDLVNNCHAQGQRPVIPPWYALAFIMFVGYL